MMQAWRFQIQVERHHAAPGHGQELRCVCNQECTPDAALV
jgi:hypothetical protein